MYEKIFEIKNLILKKLLKLIIITCTKKNNSWINYNIINNFLSLLS